ncbi:GNAT family N-acetyltransferase [Nocardia cyriacigeorgica]|uniref:GNAT family N-acetyltransferase n=1 Tax=Nocardia cyriacigeorgica TaxID=135487 RepID=UPI002B4AD4CF|nr:GNAT family N-acetyltransferase [Nocardia cyriacigeorgica]
MAIVIRPGRPEEAALLSDLALRSKGFWGYSEQLLDSFRRELTLSPSDVVDRRTAVAELNGAVVGFVTVEGPAPTGDLGMLFVVPEAIGKGIGAQLFRHADMRSRQLAVLGSIGWSSSRIPTQSRSTAQWAPSESEVPSPARYLGASCRCWKWTSSRADRVQRCLPSLPCAARPGL